MKSIGIACLGLVWAGLLTTGLEAKEPAQQHAQGFDLAHTLVVSAPPAKVYSALGQIGAWWNPAHSYSQDGRNLSLQLKAGGCFCETWGSNSVEHMRVLHAAGGKLLRMAGGLGPLQANATGVMTVSLSGLPNGQTKLDVTYAVWGQFKNGSAALEAPVSGVLLEQFTRLKDFAETGSPVSSPAPKP